MAKPSRSRPVACPQRELQPRPRIHFDQEILARRQVAQDLQFADAAGSRAAAPPAGPVRPARASGTVSTSVPAAQAAGSGRSLCATTVRVCAIAAARNPPSTGAAGGRAAIRSAPVAARRAQARCTVQQLGARGDFRVPWESRQADRHGAFGPAAAAAGRAVAQRIAPARQAGTAVARAAPCLQHQAANRGLSRQVGELRVGRMQHARVARLQFIPVRAAGSAASHRRWRSAGCAARGPVRKARAGNSSCSGPLQHLCSAHAAVPSPRRSACVHQQWPAGRGRRASRATASAVMPLPRMTSRVRALRFRWAWRVIEP